MGLVVAIAAASSLIVGAIALLLLPEISWQAGKTLSAVPSAAIAWDLEQIFPITGKRGLGLMGRAFDLLPGGTMANASCIHRGIVGVTVKMLSATRAEIINFEPIIMARGETLPDDLAPWHDELLSAFQAQPS